MHRKEQVKQPELGSQVTLKKEEFDELYTKWLLVQCQCLKEEDAVKEWLQGNLDSEVEFDIKWCDLLTELESSLEIKRVADFIGTGPEYLNQWNLPSEMEQNENCATVKNENS
jgi:hypothetical protein